MIENLTLHDAVSKHFNLKDVPEFNQALPMKQAEQFLKTKGKDIEYQRGRVNHGVVAYTNGGGVMYGIIDAENQVEFKIVGQIIGTLVNNAPKRKVRAKAAVPESIMDDESSDDETTE